jgi:hypothetical protein
MKYQYHFVILTPTYNRPEILLLMIEQLITMIKNSNYRVCHIIFNDGSTRNYTHVINKYSKSINRYKIKYLTCRKNNGIKNFWKVYNILFNELKKINFKYAYLTSDDMILCNNFLTRTKEKFVETQGTDNNVVGLNLYFDCEKKWNQTRWEDGFLIGNRQFFEHLNWKINEIPQSRWVGKSSLSSGVHEQITNRFKNSTYKLAEFNNMSFVTPRSVVSVMYGPNKKRRKGIIHNYVDK